jgi:hypothetical protein
MILDSLVIPREAFERRTGWAVKPEGLCKGEHCVPLFEHDNGQTLDVRVVAERLNMQLVHDEASGLWCLGPEALGRALTTAELPDIELPDLAGKPFRLRSLRGRKVLLVAWASW